MHLSLGQVVAQRARVSRREAANFIKNDRVELDGKICSSIATKISDRSRIKLDGVVLRGINVKQEVLLYHKPVGELCGRSDSGKASVFDKLPERETRWIMVGRLDINTSGLLLFTTDGELAYRLMHPKYQLDREYIARVKGREPVDNRTIARLKRGVVLDGALAKFTDLVPMHPKSKAANQYFHLVVQEGRNRLVRRIWQEAGYSVSRLLRIRFANISLPEDLEPGSFLLLNKTDRRRLAACVKL